MNHLRKVVTKSYSFLGNRIKWYTTFLIRPSTKHNRTILLHLFYKLLEPQELNTFIKTSTPIKRRVSTGVCIGCNASSCSRLRPLYTHWMLLSSRPIKWMEHTSFLGFLLEARESQLLHGSILYNTLLCVLYLRLFYVRWNVCSARSCNTYVNRTEPAQHKPHNIFTSPSVCTLCEHVAPWRCCLHENCTQCDWIMVRMVLECCLLHSMHAIHSAMLNARLRLILCSALCAKWNWSNLISNNQRAQKF